MGKSTVCPNLSSRLTMALPVPGKIVSLKQVMKREIRMDCSASIVNMGRKSVWQFRCTYTHSVLGSPGPAQIMSDLVMLQRLAERAVPPGSRAEGPGQWPKGGVLGCISR